MPTVRFYSLKIEGMHCKNCEKIIAKKLESFNITHFKVSFETKLLEARIKEEEINTVIETLEILGYGVTRNASTVDDSHQEAMPHKWTMILGFTLLGLYLIIKNTIGFNFIPEVRNDMSYPLLFIVGILTSLHCLSMCGGIVVSQSLAFSQEGQEKNYWKTIKAPVLYNLGRMLGYTLVGAVVGAIGSVISFSLSLQGTITILAGLMMLLLGLSLLDSFSFLRRIIKIPTLPLPDFIKKGLFKNNKAPFFIGLATAVMPCGPLQTMQLYALGTGSATQGALSMLIFSLGTVPLMLSFGAISSLISGGTSRKLLKFSGVLVMALGLIMVNRGMSLQGTPLTSLVFSTGQTVESFNGQLPKIDEEGVQVIRTSANNRGYIPNTYIIEVGKPVRWIISGDQVNGCNNAIFIPELQIGTSVKAGEDNIIEFTPEKEGNLGFTCWMGMLNGRFKVVAQS
ncbi:urease accessory protein UreH domain-containing protein [Alkaliphilus transvaalensis]|uniref:urease accessory protein UreH domain-containing protein n=1 Tax=Alkaliphilus transvaalensis TaxID=114628 RepID=UPI000553A6C2|nr:sulfite exporter TauE/SafE family protein [Alkaliphilus transvaalensis]